MLFVVGERRVEVLALITGGGARGMGTGTGNGYPRGTVGLKDGSARRPPFAAGRWSCACAGGAGAGAGAGSRGPIFRAPFPCAALTSRPSWPQRSQRRRRITDTSLAPRRATAGGGLIKDAVEAELFFVADALQTGVGLLGREVGGRIGSSDYQAAALQAGASRTAYAPARCLNAKSFAFAGGSAVILSAVHPLAEAIASASPSASVKQSSNSLTI